MCETEENLTKELMKYRSFNREVYTQNHSSSEDKEVTQNKTIQNKNSDEDTQNANK